MMILTEEGE